MGNKQASEFTIRVGDRIEVDDADGAGLKAYRVETVSPNGAVMAVNERTGLKRQFAGYGRITHVVNEEGPIDRLDDDLAEYHPQ